MKSVIAEEFMVTRLVTLDPQMDVHVAIKLLLKKRISGAPVVDSTGIFLGVFSEKCCMHVLLDSAYESLPTSHVGAFMDIEAQTIQPDTDLLSIAQVFLLTPYRRLPVIGEQGELLGQVSRRDVLAAAMRQLDIRPSTKESSLLYLSAIFDSDKAPLS